MSKSQIPRYGNALDPNGVGQKGEHLFGLSYSAEEASLIVLPVPWDLTASYGDGTRKGPEAVLDASPQLDLEDSAVERAWTLPRHMLPIDLRWQQQSQAERQWVETYIQWLETGRKESKAKSMMEGLATVNEKCAYLLEWVREQSRSFLEQGKKVAVLGGDHSTSLGLMQALGERYGSFGILQIDAHMDLREAYEGFTYSHASIMFNALQIPSLTSLVQVGIRDYCPAEKELAEEDDRIRPWYDHALHDALFRGQHWNNLCMDIVKDLPDKVYVSFDIDGLEPFHCPGTGTPVPGGLAYPQAIHLLETLHRSGREIIGFDLCEVAPSMGDQEWNANVGARMLYKLCNLCLVSPKKMNFQQINH
ncbi:MAG: agmatinase family protein [Sphingomonadales bacterium]|nr:agmatinase family protein [Sphingomonadales bacterium]